MYYEKFDVSTSDGHYTHQYMQNLAAAIQETRSIFSETDNSKVSQVNSERNTEKI